MERKVIIAKLATEEIRFEQSLRPQRLQEYIEQKKLKSMLRVCIDVVRQRREPLDHVLFYGPPGLDKTTFSGIVANETDVHMKITLGPTIGKPGDTVAVLDHLQKGNVFFIDEIHHPNRQAEEVLHPAMEGFAIDIVFDKRSNAKNTRLVLSHFILIGVTTGTGLFSAPLRDHLGVVQRLEFYEQDELQEIVLYSAKVLGVEIDAMGSAEIARHSRGIPWLADRLLRHIRGPAETKYGSAVMEAVTRDALDLLDVDTCGLDARNGTVLNLIIDMLHGGPVGLDTLAAALGGDVGMLEEVCEPYPLMQGFLVRTPRGRVAIKCAYGHLSRKKEDEGRADT